MPKRRLHHYVPVCLLRGFTTDGTDSGVLYAYDTLAARGRTTTPRAVAAERGLYTVKGSNPEAVEELFATYVEAPVGLILAALARAPRPVTIWELDKLAALVAFQLCRVPAMTRQIEKAHHGMVTLMEKFAEYMRKGSGAAGFRGEYRIPTADAPPLDQTELVRGRVWLATKMLDSFLEDMHWRVGVAEEDAPDFVCSDFPARYVTSDETKFLPLKYEMDESVTVVTMPVSARVVLLGAECMDAGQFGALCSMNATAVAGVNATVAHDARWLFSRTPEVAHAVAQVRLSLARETQR